MNWYKYAIAFAPKPPDNRQKLQEMMNGSLTKKQALEIVLDSVQNNKHGVFFGWGKGNIDGHDLGDVYDYTPGDPDNTDFHAIPGGWQIELMLGDEAYIHDKNGKSTNQIINSPIFQVWIENGQTMTKRVG